MRLTACLLAFGLALPAAGGELAWEAGTPIAKGRGERGPWQQNESRYDYVDDASAAYDERGDLAVVWVDQGRKDVFFRRLADERSVNVSRSPATFSWLPRVVRSGRNVYVLWQEIIFSGGSHGGEILFARSEDAGATFSAPLNLSNSIAGDGKGRITRESWHNGSLDLALARDGTIHAAWTEYEGRLWVTRSSDGGRNFAPLLRIPQRKPARGPSLAVAPDGVVHLAWTDGEIRFASSTDGGASFGRPRRLARGKGYADAPKLAVARDATVHLAYADEGGVHYARSTNGGRTFSSGRSISASGAGFPSLAVDAADGVYLTWERFPERAPRPRGLGYAVSRDGGRHFSEPDMVPHSVDAAGGWNGSFQGLLMKKLAVAPGGEVAVVNSSLKDLAASRVWVLRAR